ncbi:MAG: NUDIX hydrolase [Actinobacteria bacterium]|nr:NUDIX hydrolase [Actinomycetota bacterium]
MIPGLEVVLGVGDRRLAAAPGDLGVAAAHVRGARLVPEAEVHRTAVLEFLAHHHDALHRSCVAGHLTGSAAVVDASRARTLLMLHRKLGRWFQPGGHADGDGNLAGVALREATEETGLDRLQLWLPAIDVDVHEVAPPGEPPHLHLDVRFLVVAPAGATERGNHESLALRWVDVGGLDALDPDVDSSTRRLVARALGP